MGGESERPLLGSGEGRGVNTIPLFIFQVVYEGRKQYRDENGNLTPMTDPVKDKIVPKEERTIYMDGLVPKTVYSFNISAKFMDGTWGPQFQLRVETSIDG